MHGKNVLGEIDFDGDNGHDFFLLVVLMKSRNFIMALSMPFAATSPQPSDGEVPFIRWENTRRNIELRIIDGMRERLKKKLSKSVIKKLIVKARMLACPFMRSLQIKTMTLNSSWRQQDGGLWKTS